MRYLATVDFRFDPDKVRRFLQSYGVRPVDFTSARQLPQLAESLDALEQALFDATWYVEVDENLIVNPNRDPAPEFYFR